MVQDLEFEEVSALASDTLRCSFGLNEFVRKYVCYM